MSNQLKSTPAQRKAAAAYQNKIKNKLVVIRSVDVELANAIASDTENFSPLVRRLLCEHYKINAPD